MAVVAVRASFSGITPVTFSSALAARRAPVAASLETRRPRAPRRLLAPEAAMPGLSRLVLRGHSVCSR